MSLSRRTVSEILRRDVVTIAPRETLDLSQDLMSLGRVRHLPVLEDGQLVGMISNRDLLAASLTTALDFDPASRRSFLRSVEAGEVMKRDLVTVGLDATLAEAMGLMIRREIGCLPVLDGQGAFVGLVTTTDLLVAALADEASEIREGTEAMGKKSGASVSEWIEGELQDLRRMRDELRVQGHLAKAEVRDRWQALEKTFDALEQRVKRASRIAEPPLQQIESDLRKLVDDLREGYRRIRDAI